MNMFFLNNESIEDDSPKIALYTYAFKYGDGLFETIRVYKGKILHLNEHLTRLFTGMYYLKYRFHEEKFQNDIEMAIFRMIDLHQLYHARLRLQVFRRESILPAEFMIEAESIEDYFTTTLPYSLTSYRLMPLHFSPVSGFKTSYRLPYQLANMYAKEKGFDEAILWSTESAAETSNHNLFIVKKKHIYTPPLQAGCLNGIMRMQIIRLCQKLEIPLSETHISEKDLQNADEIFLTNALRGIIPVWRYEDIAWENPQYHITNYLKQNFLQILEIKTS